MIDENSIYNQSDSDEENELDELDQADLEAGQELAEPAVLDELVHFCSLPLL